MAFPSLLARTAAILLAAALLLFPVLSPGGEDDCCRAVGASECAGEHGGAPGRGKDGAEDDGPHACVHCGCGACQLPSLVEKAAALSSPGAAGRFVSRGVTVPSSEPLPTLDRPPSA
jgi:hypothetical protein